MGPIWAFQEVAVGVFGRPECASCCSAPQPRRSSKQRSRKQPRGGDDPRRVSAANSSHTHRRKQTETRREGWESSRRARLDAPLIPTCAETDVHKRVSDSRGPAKMVTTAALSPAEKSSLFFSQSETSPWTRLCQESHII